MFQLNMLRRVFSMLIKNVKVYTMADGDTDYNVIENGYIYIRDNLIAKVGSMESFHNFSLQSQDSQGQDLQNQEASDQCFCINSIDQDEVIDGTGLVAYPGFVDAHCHISLWEDSVGAEGEDGNEENDPITPHLRALDAINPFDRCFKDALEAGVTSVVVSPGSANPIGGQVVAIKTFGHRVDNMVIKEPVAMKFALGENPKKVYGDKEELPSTRMTIAAVIREQLQKAKRYMNEIDYAESDEGYDEPDYDVKCEALMPLLQKKIQAHFHAHRADDIFTALRISKEFNLDSVIIHATDGHLIAQDLQEESAKIIAGPLFCDRSKVELKNLNSENVAKLSNFGLNVAISTDHPVVPVEYLTFSAALAVKDGMDKMEALKSITINPAKICALDDKIGSIQEGKDADIVLFDEDVFGLKVKPKIVIINGKRVI